MRTQTEPRGTDTGSGQRGLYRVKPAFVGALHPIRRYLIDRGVRPTTITLAAVPVEAAAAAFLVLGVLIADGFLVLVPPTALAWMALNAMDGSVARSTGRTSVSGAALNEFVDRLGDLLVIGAASFIAPAWVVVLLAVGVLTSELVAVIGWTVTGRRDFVGIMGKPDRALVLALAASAAVVWSPALVVGLVVIGIGSAIGSLVRAHHVLAVASELDRSGIR